MTPEPLHAHIRETALKTMLRAPEDLAHPFATDLQNRPEPGPTPGISPCRSSEKSPDGCIQTALARKPRVSPFRIEPFTVWRRQRRISRPQGKDTAMTTTRSAIATLVAAGLVATVTATLPANPAIDSRLTISPTETAETGHDLTLGADGLLPATANASGVGLTQTAARRTSKKFRNVTAVPGRSGLARRHQKRVRRANSATNSNQAALDCSIQSHPDCQPSGNGTTEHFFTLELGN